MAPTQMDGSEAQVDAYLRHLKYSNIIFEPDGNVPPDFLVDGSIAIEVRRLNQNPTVDGKTEGIEKAAIPLNKRIEKLLNNFGPPNPPASWFVGYRFQRPLENLKTLSAKISTVLEAFLASPSKERTEFDLGGGFRLIIRPKFKPGKNIFMLGIMSDRQAGGWLVHEMQKNLNICIEEKTAKIQKAKSKYPEWWLILVDRIAYGLEPDEWATIRSMVPKPKDWGKIILVSPKDPTRAIEL